MKKPGIIFVGPLAPPIGGVSSHVAGLAGLLSTNGFPCTILDGYSATQQKYIIPNVEHFVFRNPLRFFKIQWFLYSEKSNSGESIHLHFSQIIGHALIFAFFFKRGRKLFLTLHDGDQAGRYQRATWPLRLLARLMLRRMDKIVALSRKQEKFYISMGVSKRKVERWETTVTLPVVSDSTLLPSDIRALKPIEDGGEETILVTSGYPNESYGIDDCLELLDRVGAHYPCRLIVCLYGVSSQPAYEQKLRARLIAHPRVHLVDTLPAPGFFALLSKASLYLRPSRIDSYGLAITEALNLGIPSLASDVCGRDSRCTLFPTGDMKQFVEKAIEMIETGQKSRKRDDVGRISDQKFQNIVALYE